MGNAGGTRGVATDDATGDGRRRWWAVVALAFVVGSLGTAVVVEWLGLAAVLQPRVVDAADVHLVRIAPWEPTLIVGELAVVVGLVLAAEALAYCLLRPYLPGWGVVRQESGRSGGSRSGGSRSGGGRSGWVLAGLAVPAFAVGTVLSHVFLTPLVVERLVSGSPVLTLSQWGSLLASVSVAAGVIAQAVVVGLACSVRRRTT